MSRPGAPVLEFRGEDFSSTATMTPQTPEGGKTDTSPYIVSNGDAREEQQYQQQQQQEQEQAYQHHQYLKPHEEMDENAPADLPAEEQGDTSRTSNSARVPKLTRASFVRTPAAKDDFRGLDDDVVVESERPPEVDVLITELKDQPELVEGDHYEGSDGESDIDEEYKQVTVETVDAGQPEDEWDTDLEIEDELIKEAKNHDPSGRSYYGKVCDKMGLVPISYFVRHILDHEITMRWHGLGPAAAKAIALVLRDNITLEKLNIQGNWIEGDGGLAMARMLEDNDYITEVNLSDNRLGSLGARCMCKMLSVNAGLRKLDLSGNNFDDKDALIFAEALEHTKCLKDLNLSRNLFGSVGGEVLGPAIGANDVLEVLDLSWNHIRGTGAIAVAKGLGENVRLKTCRLGWNGFGPEGGSALGEAMTTNNSLLELDISGNRLNADSAMKLARMITCNDTLRTVRLGNNLITTSGAVALATSINGSESSEIEELDLTDIPIEFEFLRILEDIKSKKCNFVVTHGPILSSGNTADDIGAPAVHTNKRKEPVMILQNHIVVNDMRLLDILKKYDPSDAFTVTPEDFVKAVEDLAVAFNKPKLEAAVKRLADEQAGKIYFGDFIKQREEQMAAGNTGSDVQNVPQSVPVES